MQMQSEYPRTYRVVAPARLFLYGFAIFLLAFFLVATVLQLAKFMKHSLVPLQLVPMDGLVVIFAVYLCMRASRRVILYEDAIETKGLLSTRKLNRDEIRGRRLIYTRNGSFFVVLPLDRSKKALWLPMWLEMDRPFFRWMKTIPLLPKHR
jgi:hypothetical protein